MLGFIWFVAFVVVIVFEIITKRKLEKGQISEEPLTVGEKVLTWICCLFNPIISGAILYYGWRKRLPTKAKTANRISWIAFSIVILLGGSWYFVISFSY
ncbi:MAG: hypothetical protein ACYSSP_14380 [Planctomycetota bacterium]|jgi:hypothetical protein